MSHPAEGLQEQAKKKREAFRKVVKAVKKRPPGKLDEWFEDAHDVTFQSLDCLDCSNCCSTTSPMFFDKDIERLSGHLRMKPGTFIEQYLYLDTDGIYALKQTPCPFLGVDRYCSVYEYRPKACREFPHTRHRRMVQKLDLAVANSSICPAVFRILEALEQSWTTIP
jgi:Fe-S-cluster containining protein